MMRFDFRLVAPNKIKDYVQVKLHKRYKSFLNGVKQAYPIVKEYIKEATPKFKPEYPSLLG